MQQLYTTAEASKVTGIPEGTIRAWLSRYSGAFQDVHIVVEGSKKLWTQAGIELLQARAAENATKNVAFGDTDAIENATPTATSNVADGVAFHDAMVENFTDRVAMELAATVCEHLPGRTLHHIHRMLNAPLPQEKETLQRSMQQAMQLLPSPAGKQQTALPPAQER